MEIPIYHIDAFSKEVFHGNPAGVCLLDHWLEDGVLMNIARENNLPETAFVIERGDHYEIRWFAPEVEMDLCGHGTLASGFAVLNFLRPAEKKIRFVSPRSGELMVAKEGDRYILDFPSQPPEVCEPPAGLIEGLRKKPQEVLKSQDYLVVYEKEEIVRDLTPDFQRLKQLDLRGVIVTAQGEQADFVSRFFAPKTGFAEDPVTGSAHCALIPYWKRVLDKRSFNALQLSARGGELFCEDRGDRVLISGHAACYLVGTLSI